MSDIGCKHGHIADSCAACFDERQAQAELRDAHARGYAEGETKGRGDLQQCLNELAALKQENESLKSALDLHRQAIEKAVPARDRAEIQAFYDEIVKKRLVVPRQHDAELARMKQENADLVAARDTQHAKLMDENERLIAELGHTAAVNRVNEELHAQLANLRTAANEMVDAWNLWTSQEMYGEHIREGMPPSDFEAWQEAVSKVCAALNATEAQSPLDRICAGMEGKKLAIKVENLDAAVAAVGAEAPAPRETFDPEAVRLLCKQIALVASRGTWNADASIEAIYDHMQRVRDSENQHPRRDTFDPNLVRELCTGILSTQWTDRLARGFYGAADRVLRSERKS